MIGHEQSGHDLAFEHMPFHDFCDVGFGADPYHTAFRIDHHAWTQLAMVEAPGFIGANKTFQIQPFRFVLKMGMELFRSQVCTTATGVVLRTLICTDKDMALKWWHTDTAAISAW